MGRNKVWPPVLRKHGKQAVCWFQGREWVCGEWIQKGPNQVAVAEHGRLVAVWAVDPHAAYLPAGEMLVSGILAAYVASNICDFEARQAARAAELLGGHLVTPAKDFGPAEFAAWRGELCRQFWRGKPLSRPYVVKLMSSVRRAWRWAVEAGHLPADRWLAISAVRNPRADEAKTNPPVEPAPPESVRAVLPFLQPPVRAMVELQLLTGCRPSEVARMRPCDVHRSGVLRVPGVGLRDLDALRVWVYVPVEHKTSAKGKSRWLVLAGEACEVLRPFLDREPAANCFSPAESRAGYEADAKAKRKGLGSRKPKSDEPKRKPGRSYAPDSYLNALKRACDRAGVPRFTPYQIRHLVADQIADAGTRDDARAVLGHAGIRTTEGYLSDFGKSVEVARRRGATAPAAPPVDASGSVSARL